MRSYRIIGLLIGMLVMASCGKKAPIVNRPAFCSDSAYAYIEKQMSFGPRVPNSAAHAQCAAWLVEQLRACGAEVTLSIGELPDYRGNNQKIYNIIGRFYTPEIADRPRVLLGAHYDTRPWCDEEPNYEDRSYNVPGANDGASGVGVLLEIARQLGLREADSTLYTPVDIVFFDVEDMGTPQSYTGMERSDTWCLGSQLWAANYVNDGTQQYHYGIVLDMVGAPNAIFPLEYYSTQYASSFQQQIWRSAKRLGYDKLFVSEQAYPILDDHYYVNHIGGIPCIDIIHYNMHSSKGFPSWWHTRQDDMRNISKETLQAVGEVVMSQL